MQSLVDDFVTLKHFKYLHSFLYGSDAISSVMSYGRDRGRSFNSGPKPVEVGKEYDVQISEVSNRGDGIARIQGFIIFVKDGKVADNVKIRVISVGDRFAKAELV